MDKDDVKKVDELTVEELDNVNGGKIRFKSKDWWDKMKGKDQNKTGGAKATETGASGSW